MRDSPSTTGTGGGKLILFGEHAVVYGVPAVVASLGTGATATAQRADQSVLTLEGSSGDVLVSVEPDDSASLAESFAAILGVFGEDATVAVRAGIHLPVGAGLGSSAALAVAVARAIADLAGAGAATVERAVAASERVFHGEPSGIDETAALRGGLFAFRRTDTEPEIRPLTAEPVELLVCLAEPGASTAELVGQVRAFHERHPRVAERIDDAIGDVVQSGIDALEAGDHPALGELMNVNHGLLSSFGVSTAGLDRACAAARAAGAYGAKLTGAGGGGCVFAIAPEERRDAVLQAWAETDLPTFSYEI